MYFKQGDSVNYIFKYNNGVTKKLNGIIVSSFSDNEVYYNKPSANAKFLSINYVFMNIRNYSLYNYGEDTFIVKEENVLSKKINLVEKIHPFFKLFKTTMLSNI